jgi:hypothetical protein
MSWEAISRSPPFIQTRRLAPAEASPGQTESPFAARREKTRTKVFLGDRRISRAGTLLRDPNHPAANGLSMEGSSAHMEVIGVAIHVSPTETVRSGDHSRDFSPQLSHSQHHRVPLPCTVTRDQYLSRCPKKAPGAVDQVSLDSTYR